MNNRIKTGVSSEDRNEAGQFAKGVSGNPGGRPKKTQAEMEAVDRLKKLTPHAVDVVEGILDNENASFYARLQAAEIIFNRAMGRPETYLKVENGEKSVEASVASLQELFGTADDDPPVMDTLPAPDEPAASSSDSQEEVTVNAG